MEVRSREEKWDIRTVWLMDSKKYINNNEKSIVDGKRNVDGAWSCAENTRELIGDHAHRQRGWSAQGGSFVNKFVPIRWDSMTKARGEAGIGGGFCMLWLAYGCLYRARCDGGFREGVSGLLVWMGARRDGVRGGLAWGVSVGSDQTLKGCWHHGGGGGRGIGPGMWTEFELKSILIIMMSTWVRVGGGLAIFCSCLLIPLPLFSVFSHFFAIRKRGGTHIPPSPSQLSHWMLGYVLEWGWGGGGLRDRFLGH